MLSTTHRAVLRRLKYLDIIELYIPHCDHPKKVFISPSKSHFYHTTHTSNYRSKPIFTMEKAKQAVSNFISGDGHHKTTVHEDVNRPVTEEQVHTHRHENVTTAVDREVHQDHHHTTVQPVKAQETL